jgi:hypothetical protein
MNPAIFPKRPAWLVLSLPLLAGCLLAGWLLWPHAFFHGYWLGLMFWTQLSVGALMILLLQQLTGGKWGVVAAPLARATMSGFLLLVPLFIPMLFALPHLFSWTKIEVGVSSAVLVNKQVWLNQPAFIARTVFYLVALAGVILWWRRVPPPPPAGPVLALLIIIMSFFCSDWMMSLQPTFYSSLYPFMYFSDAMVFAFAVLTGTVAWLQVRGSLALEPKILIDFGKLLFSAVLFWGYIAFSQFIIIWTGNLPDEAEWYVIRSSPSWVGLTAFVVLFYFAVPFCMLLSLRLKKQPRRLMKVCVALVVLHLVEMFWLMRPTPGEGLRLSPFDFIMPILIGAAWLWFVLGTPAARTSVQVIRQELERHE